MIYLLEWYWTLWHARGHCDCVERVVLDYLNEDCFVGVAINDEVYFVEDATRRILGEVEEMCANEETTIVKDEYL